MSRSNRIAFLTLGFTGTLAIIGAGFSAWVFVGENTTVSAKMDASVNITQYLEVGILQMEGEIEARKEVWKDDCNLYDYYSMFQDDEKANYELFNKLVNQYTYRKIVFTEGNPDSSALDDGLEFLRFYNDQKLKIKTFKSEPTIYGKFLIPNSYVDPKDPEFKNVKFHIGVKVMNIDNPESKEKSAIDDYIQLNEKYSPKDDLSNSFKLGDHNYTAFENPINAGLFNFKDAGTIDNFIDSNGQVKKYRKYEFNVDLSEMFWYEEGMKPYNSASVKQIKDSIEKSTGEKDWSISFQFASCLYQD